MTLTFTQIALYTGALAVLFLTPGPVWLALIARALSGGFRAAWPLAVGVVVGDTLWPLVAIFGISFLISIYDDFLIVLRFGGAVIFVLMGLAVIRHADRVIGQNTALTAPGAWAGFAAGLLAILGNPKAILFYMGMLPGFFDLTVVTGLDIAVICAISALVPFAGNIALALSLDQVRALISSPLARRRLNLGAGILLIVVGGLIAVL